MINVFKKQLLTEKIPSKGKSNYIEVGKIVKTKTYISRGYEVRDEFWKGPEKMEQVLMKRQAYNFNGDWIGKSKWAYRLYNRYGVTHTEKIKENHSVCSIGFSEEEQKWYGWSHRAICGFEVGSTVKFGDSAFVASNMEERILSAMNFFKKSREEAIEYIKNEDKQRASDDTWGPFKYGRGKWTAKTLSDAKQMAIDFAESVS